MRRDDPSNPYRILPVSERTRRAAAADGVDTRSRPALDAWIAVARKDGRWPVSSKSGAMNVDLPR
jgi:hypothetical protein